MLNILIIVFNIYSKLQQNHNVLNYVFVWLPLFYCTSDILLYMYNFHCIAGLKMSVLTQIHFKGSHSFSHVWRRVVDFTELANTLYKVMFRIFSVSLLPLQIHDYILNRTFVLAVDLLWHKCVFYKCDNRLNKNKCTD